MFGFGSKKNKTVESRTRGEEVIVVVSALVPEETVQRAHGRLRRLELSVEKHKDDMDPVMVAHMKNARTKIDILKLQIEGSE